MVLNEYYTFSNGVKIPKLGLGTWFIEDSKVPEAVKQAVQIGYRHIDTAQAYGNEAGVGCGINKCGVSNFLIDDLQNILDCCTIKPMVNQKGILPEAYSPIAHGEALKNRILQKWRKNIGYPLRSFVSGMYCSSVWLPCRRQQIRSIWDVDFEISDEDMSLLKSAQKIESYGEYSVFPVFSGK